MYTIHVDVYLRVNINTKCNYIADVASLLLACYISEHDMSLIYMTNGSFELAYLLSIVVGI